MLLIQNIDKLKYDQQLQSRALRWLNICFKIPNYFSLVSFINGYYYSQVLVNYLVLLIYFIYVILVIIRLAVCKFIFAS